jgi:hypothetical protein
MGEIEKALMNKLTREDIKHFRNAIDNIPTHK